MKTASPELWELLSEDEANIFSIPETKEFSEFCESEIFIPKGLAAGQFSHETLPLLKDISVELGKRSPHQYKIIIGPKQTGKTVIGIHCPVIYYWLELNQDTIFFMPTREIAFTNWRTKILPMVKANPELFRKLPSEGLSSKGAVPNEIISTDGAVLYFVGSSGSDIQMSSISAHNCFADEVEKMQHEKSTSEEGSPVDQVIARTDAYQLDKLIILVCTITTESGRMWQEYKSGTRGLPFVKCPKCKKRIVLEFDRELFDSFYPDKKRLATSFIYDDTDSVKAKKTAFLECPLCEKKINDKDRLLILKDVVWVYEGQYFDKKGKLKGEIKRTISQSWRWNQLYSPFTSLGLLAMDHLAAQDSEIKKKAFQLSKIALPWKDDTEIMEIKRALFVNRSKRSFYELKEIPEDVVFIIVGADVQKRLIYWTATGFDMKGNKWLVDIGIFDIIKKSSDQSPSDDAIIAALEELDEMVQEGWQRKDKKTFIFPVMVGVDSGYRKDVIAPWLKSHGKKYKRIIGLGKKNTERLRGKSTYTIEGLLDVRRQPNKTYIYFVHTDESKARVHDKFLLGPNVPGRHELPNDLLKNYTAYTFHLVAEQRQKTFDPKRGEVVVWVQVRRRNDWLDIEGYIEALGNMQIRILNYEQEQDTKPKNEKPPDNAKVKRINRQY